MQIFEGSLKPRSRRSVRRFVPLVALMEDADVDCVIIEMTPGVRASSEEEKDFLI